MSRNEVRVIIAMKRDRPFAAFLEVLGDGKHKFVAVTISAAPAQKMVGDRTIALAVAFAMREARLNAEELRAAGYELAVSQSSVSDDVTFEDLRAEFERRILESAGSEVNTKTRGDA